MSKNDARKIVVALDGSKHSLKALDAGAELARETGGSLSLLCVYPHRPGMSAAFSGVDEQSSREGLERRKEEYEKKIFSEAEDRLGSESGIADRYAFWGDPAEEIIDFMEEHPDMHLVLGRRGTSHVKRLIMGGVSDKVVHHASGLVTIVPSNNG